MFSKLTLLAFVAPLVSALTLQIPENPTSGGSVTIKWNSAQGDPDTWTFELLNTVFNNAFAIANNVDPSTQQLTLTLPVVPVGDGYTLEAVDIGDINKVFASTGSFSIGPNAGSTSSSTGTATPSSTTSVSTTRVTSPSGTPTSVTTTRTTTSTSATNVSTTATNTNTNTAVNNAPSTGAALSSRVNFGSAGGFAAVLLSAVAGAVVVAL
ncbi:hypothetical protein B0H34DRAFT_680889 [Crassisporium funariophilum]|nr:hypothetical protein B0H34DRAFT_680889 [Crassisporium funariophilum]